MLLQLYDIKHTRIAGLKNHKDAMVESELSTGDKTLSFLWHSRNKQKIPQEYYIRTDTDEYVVKENSAGSKSYRKIVAKLNIEEIEGRAWSEFIVSDCTAQEAANYALTDTGWTCVSTVPEAKLRNINLKNVSSYQIIEKILEAFTCEVTYDTFSKIVYLKEQVGEDKGAYFIDGLNLKEISDNADTYDYATIIIPIGADGLGIEDVNDGKNYLENYQYSNKKKSVIWEDASYTDAQALKDDAEYRLAEISKPKRTLRAKTIDLARIKPEYQILSYSVGDIATFISEKKGIKEKQRITKTTEYLENPEKNTCDISNTVLSFEELQKKLFAAAECVSNIIIGNSTVRGASVDAIDVTQIIGLERYVSEDITDLKVDSLYARTEFGTPYAVIGQAVLTQTQSTNLTVTGREDVQESHIQDLYIENVSGTNAVFKTIESDNIATLEARIDKITSTEITTEYLETHYAQIDFANVNAQHVATFFADVGLIKDATVIDGHITGYLDAVNVNADNITAGTLAVDRLVIRGSEDSLMYELNNITGALQSVSVDTLNGEVITPRTINCDRIVAESITGNEIAASTITADKLVANTITSNEIAAGTITADKLNVSTLSAISGNIGTITAGVFQSTNYVADLSGMKLNLADGQWDSKNFKIDADGDVVANTILLVDGVYGTYTANGVVQSDKVQQLVSFEASRVIKVETYDYDSSTGMFLFAKTELRGGSGTDTTCWNYFQGTCSFEGDFQVAGVSKFEECVYFAGGAHLEHAYIKQALQVGGEAYIENLKVSTIYEGGTALSAKYQAKGSYAAASHTHSYLPLSGGTVTGTLVLSKTIDLSGTENKSPALIVGGAATAAHMELDNNEIQAKANGTTVANLYINPDGGDIYLGDSANSCYIRCRNDVIAPSLSLNGDCEIKNTLSASSVIYICPNGNYATALGTEGTYACSNAYFRPGVTDYSYLGSGSYRWKQIYTNASAISTSDRNEKTNIARLTEVHMKFFMMLIPVSYMFINGDTGRTHIGFISQDVEEAMNACGLTDLDFAGFCKDVKCTAVVETELVVDEDGQPVLDNAGEPRYRDVEYEVPVLDENGNKQYIYSLRYEEFIALIAYVVQETVNDLTATKNELSEVQTTLKSVMSAVAELQLKVG